MAQNLHSIEFRAKKLFPKLCKENTMRKIKTLIAGFAVASFMGAAYASPITVGGITWDPDYSEPFGTGEDYEARFEFTQWFSSTSTAGGFIGAGNFTNALKYGTIVTDATNGGSFGNYWLQGVGEVSYMNGSNTFGAPSSELTYAFGGIKLNANGSFDTSNGWFKVYVNSTTPNYTAPTSNEGEVADAQSGLLWLGGTFNSLVNSSGSVQNTFVSAELQVTEGAAKFHFSPTLEYSGSAFFAPLNPNAKYSQAGNGQLKGNTIPEPATLALMGMGLLGFSAARRYSNKNAAD